MELWWCIGEWDGESAGTTCEIFSIEKRLVVEGEVNGVVDELNSKWW
jgi:hypothetical protein